jgi:hypothetical protein
MTLPFAEYAVPTVEDLRSSCGEVASAIRFAQRDAESPYAVDKQWTRRQLAWHIADTETAIVLRLCHIIAEDRPRLTGIPEDLWAAALPQRRSLDVAASWFQASRETVIDLLPGVDAKGHGRIGLHSSLGEMTFDETLRHLHHHALHHSQQLRSWPAR